MDLSAGAGVWVPCEVRPGPFCNERRVLIEDGDNEWFGFVATHWLKDKVEEGRDQVLAKVVDIQLEKGTFHAAIPGNAPKPSLFEGQVNRAVAGQ